jgi:hypothetical protein
MRPAERSMRWWRDHGYFVGRTEHWNPFAKRRVDLFNFIDLLCVNTGSIVAVQVTTSDGHPKEHIEKITTSPIAKAWLASGETRIVLDVWKKRRNKWELWQTEIVV